ncbi:MAG TPA: hypothetical protein VFO25_08385 [Candidatus Eremiobacteraceae bacterium]|nr:hypothetical protein [Candidatus Eremiobacteraceae bacterium]
MLSFRRGSRRALVVATATLLIATFSAADAGGMGRDPYAGSGNPCGPPTNVSCNASPAPTSTPTLGQSCTVGPSTWLMNGLVGVDNVTCIPARRIILTLDGNPNNGSTSESQGTMNQYVDLLEEQGDFKTDKSWLDANDPSTGSGYPWTAAMGTTSLTTGHARPIHYSNPSIVHSNDDASQPSSLPSQGALCTAPFDTGIKLARWLLNTSGATESWLLHLSGGGVVKSNRIYFTTGTCTNGGSTEYPQDYIANMGSATYRAAWQTYYRGTCSSCADQGLNRMFLWQTDQSPTTIASLVTTSKCTGLAPGSSMNTNPCNASSSTVTTQEYPAGGDGTGDAAMVADRIGFWTSMNRNTGGSEPGSGSFLFGFNGLSTGLPSSNFMKLATTPFTASNVAYGEFEEVAWGFNPPHSGCTGGLAATLCPDTRSWPHFANTMSLLQGAFAQGQFAFVDDYECGKISISSCHSGNWTAAIKDQERTIHTALVLLFGSYNGGIWNIIDRESIDNDDFAYANTYPDQHLMVTGPNKSMSAFTAMLDQSASTDGHMGNGCDAHDAAGDHGWVDLLISGTCTGNTDFKGTAAGVVCNEFDDAYFDAVPISSAFSSSVSANYMAVCLNESTSAITVQSTWFPAHGTGYNRVVGYNNEIQCAPGNLGGCDTSPHGGALVFSMFTLGMDKIAPESGLLLVHD